MGSEGTLGIITAAVLKLVPQPKEIAVAFCAVNSATDALALFARVQAHDAAAISAFELMSGLGTTVFEVMSALAREHQSVNLGQGFPDDKGPEAVREAAAKYLLEGHNQYPPMMGLPELRRAVAEEVPLQVAGASTAHHALLAGKRNQVIQGLVLTVLLGAIFVVCVLLFRRGIIGEFIARFSANQKPA